MLSSGEQDWKLANASSHWIEGCSCNSFLLNIKFLSKNVVVHMFCKNPPFQNKMQDNPIPNFTFACMVSVLKGHVRPSLPFQNGI
jgi:hypothetical protein